jgi:hypothetical protein
MGTRAEVDAKFSENRRRNCQRLISPPQKPSLASVFVSARQGIFIVHEHARGEAFSITFG